VAITPVTVIDVAAGAARPDSTVVVHGDRIAAVGPAATTPVPAGAEVIDGRGKYLIPGLWDMHAHIVDPAMLPLFTRYGVTGVRQMFALSSGYAPGSASTCPPGPPARGWSGRTRCSTARTPGSRRWSAETS